jgi:hypothetical protein
MCKTRGPYKLNLIGQNQAWRWRRVWRMWNIFLDAAAPRHRRPISRPMPGMPGRCAGPSCWRVGGVTLAPWHPAGAARGGRATTGYR